MIEKFSKEEFEKALPVNKNSGEPLWRCLGLQEGEYTYIIPILREGVFYVNLLIRSSIDSTGYAKNTGEDSIRLYFMLNEKPHGSKLSCYITRVPGWQKRLEKQIRIMYKRGGSLNRCPICQKRKAMFKSKKNKSLFQACPDHFKDTYEPYSGE